MIPKKALKKQVSRRSLHEQSQIAKASGNKSNKNKRMAKIITQTEKKFNTKNAPAGIRVFCIGCFTVDFFASTTRLTRAICGIIYFTLNLHVCQFRRV